MNLISDYVKVREVTPKQSNIIQVQEDFQTTKQYNIAIVLEVDKTITDIKPGDGVMYGLQYYGYHIGDDLYIKSKDILIKFITQI